MNWIKETLKWLGRVSIFALLTAISQIGGIVYLLCLPFFNRLKQSRYHLVLWFVVYTLVSSFLVPIIAPKFGRVALPISKTGDLQPHTWWTCWLNRHYVTPKLKSTIDNAIRQFQLEFPDQQVTYLDANFPFWDGFPLLPHLSHNDGRKLDLSFIYRNKNNNKIQSGGARSLLGYGVCEEPQASEFDQAKICQKQGYWMYSFTKKFVFGGHPENIEADDWRTSKLISSFASNPSVRKIFLEPHLVKRWQLNKYSNVVFHGCHAVRHDDHIHIQL